MSVTPRANLIARAVIAQFNKLPAKRKPTVRDNGLHEWVPLSGIVAEQDGNLTCLALATGMKCLPASKLADANGNAIHDWHAEVLAMRAFNRFLLDECEASARHGRASQVIDVVVPDGRIGGRPFRIKDNVRLHMYCSEAPCRAYFSQLGIVRRKPSRGDAPPTLSKSCSDKITLKQCTSLLSSLTSLLVDPSSAYIDRLVLPSSQYSASACQRAFSGRLRPLVDDDEGRPSAPPRPGWPGGYRFAPFQVETTDEEFAFSRRSAVARAGTKIAPSNLAAVWTAGGVEETVLGGVLQGRRPFEDKGASGVSRRRMWVAAATVAATLRADAWGHVQRCLAGGRQTYRHVKDCHLLADRRRVKREVCESALVGWVPNRGDEGFSIALP
ncbi:hypothetical protein E4U42_004526 [Claviceps africana]|uniref:A to I editase domain-containing protein n=1 Tax=Claviceps africana TaxID=83212 RepID=A0A8K0J7B6_9HYPO|nr:hypothetical protein E4U42_004526 [Claviceps africana]